MIFQILLSLAIAAAAVASSIRISAGQEPSIDRVHPKYLKLDASSDVGIHAAAEGYRRPSANGNGGVVVMEGGSSA